MGACGSGWGVAVVAVAVIAGCGGGAHEQRDPIVVGALELVAQGEVEASFTIQPRRWSEVVKWSRAEIGSAEVTYVELGESPHAVAAFGADVWLARPDGLVRLRGDGVRATFARLPRAGWPTSLVRASDGAVWFSLWGAEVWTGRLDPDGGHVSLFHAPAPVRRATALAFERRADGDHLWLGSADTPTVATVDSMDAGRTVSVVATDGGPEVSLALAGLAVKDDGQVWVGDFANERVGAVVGGEFRWHALGSGVAPAALVIGGDGRPWFAAPAAPMRIGRVQRDGRVETFVLPSAVQTLSDRGIGALVAAPDGAVWFSLPERDRLGRVDAEGGFAFVGLAADARPGALAFDARGVLWVATSFGVARVQPL